MLTRRILAASVSVLSNGGGTRPTRLPFEVTRQRAQEDVHAPGHPAAHRVETQVEVLILQNVHATRDRAL
jgi:hypothetical protein